MRRPYPTVHVDHESSVPFPSGLVGKPTLVGGHLSLKSSTGNSHQAFKRSKLERNIRTFRLWLGEAVFAQPRGNRRLLVLGITVQFRE